MIRAWVIVEDSSKWNPRCSYYVNCWVSPLSWTIRIASFVFNVVFIIVEYFSTRRLFASFLWHGDDFFCSSTCFSTFNSFHFHQSAILLLRPLHVHPRHGTLAITQEKKLSTAYILFEVLIQIFLCNAALTIVSYPLYYLKLGDAYTFIGYECFPTVFIFIWCKIAENPCEATRFFFSLCFIPMKYIPVCFVLGLAIFRSPIFPLIV